MIKDFNGVLICASKYFTTSEMRSINKLGITNFGENTVDELLLKKDELQDLSLTWHYIGRLQTNKIKKVINEIDYLHSLDNLRQADYIEKYRNEPLNCFIQVKYDDKDSKSGVEKDKLDNFIQNLKKYDKIKVVGLMTMGKYQDDLETKRIFKDLKKLKDKYNLDYLSMGMTDDYQIAVDNGATHIRLGSYFKDLI